MRLSTSLSGFGGRVALVVAVAALLTIDGSPRAIDGSRRASDSSAPPADEGKIVFFATEDAGSASYFAADPDSRRSSRLTRTGVEVAKWRLESSGRSALAPCVPSTLATSDDPAANFGICRVDVVSGDRTLVVDTGRPVQFPTPSPVAGSIVFASGAEADHGLKLVPLDGGEVVRLCNGFCPLYRFSDISWSPDGTRVVFVGSTPGSGSHLPQIYVVTAGESDYTQLTSTSAMESGPRWSPDGTRLAFASSRTGDTELWVMNADGSDQVQLTRRPGPDLGPSWSPDGSRIVYSRRINDSWDLATISASGGETRALTTMPGTETEPVWLASAASTGPHLVSP